MHPTENLPVQSVARYDLETGHMQLWSKGSRYFMGEPQFIPRKQLDDPGVHPLMQQGGAALHAGGSASHASGSGSSASGAGSNSNGTGFSANGPRPSITSSGFSAHAENPSSSSASQATPRVLTGIREDDGWILSVGFDAELQRSEVVLLDAADIEAGPIAVLPLASPVGYGIHGTWVPAYYGP